MRADPELIARWTRAWAISREAAPPVVRDGALYVHVGTDEQVGRYIFDHLDTDAITDLVTRIRQPLLYLKVCAPGDSVRALLPSGWQIAAPGYMMTSRIGTMLNSAPTLDPEFALSITTDGAITFAYIVDSSGEEAARGRIVALDDMVVFDRIRTAEAHQRRGLGTWVMRSLAHEARRLGIGNAMLCATPAGRELYTSLGWEVHSDYTTASLKG